MGRTYRVRILFERKKIYFYISIWAQVWLGKSFEKMENPRNKNDLKFKRKRMMNDRIIVVQYQWEYAWNDNIMYRVKLGKKMEGNWKWVMVG